MPILPTDRMTEQDLKDAIRYAPLGLDPEGIFEQLYAALTELQEREASEPTA
ncbi:hypothetical protein [Streptomyces virginiae]|uniref:hypothetical protein n=1 Tax=Streptomyces virginiae TaxID=1961 RepID=UPI00224E610F|nr:hypothetical protein [Streptomyces virginiae]MCX5176741.1 hypothetical protein [Streptomyces virginiae]